MPDASPSEEDEKVRTAEDAVGLLLAGQADAGLALYETCLRRAKGYRIPTGLHLLFLEQAGLAHVAEDLRRIALRRGGNVAVKEVLGASAVEVAEEYETLFAHGIANSRMIFRLLVALSRSGRAAEVAAILDPDRLLQTVRLDLPGPDGEAGGLAQAVQEMLIREEPRSVDRDATQPLNKVPMLERLHKSDDPAARALTAALRAQADHYLTEWAASEHPLAHLVERNVDLKAWALFARGTAFTTRHIHSQGWATGVYYPAGIQPGTTGGDLIVGPPEEIEDMAPWWPRAKIRPEPGLLVLMPSYCMHWTLPLSGEALRTSVAFDLLDVD